MYEAAVVAVTNAEKALKTLREFSDIQYKAKGETMREQIANYIADVLSNVNHMRVSCQYYDLSLSRMNNKDIFYVQNSFNFGSPIFTIDLNGKTRYLEELNEDQMLTVIRYWDGFKEQLNYTIKVNLKTRTESINKEIAHIAYMNEQLAKWSV